jgi:hypothetical protein
MPLARDSSRVVTSLRRRASHAKAALTGWDAPGIGTARGQQNTEKRLTKANPNLSPRSPHQPVLSGFLTSFDRLAEAIGVQFGVQCLRQAARRAGPHKPRAAARRLDQQRSLVANEDKDTYGCCNRKVSNAQPRAPVDCQKSDAKHDEKAGEIQALCPFRRDSRRISHSRTVAEAGVIRRRVPADPPHTPPWRRHDEYEDAS